MLDLMTRTFANVVTLLNIIFGSLALIYILNNDYRTAAILILVAAVMDGMDGRVARKFDAESEMGKELDSLCDLVSFGVAPAILLYSQILHQHFMIISLLVTLLFIVCGALRLARFNVLNISEYFVGIPITLAGMVMAVISLLAGYISPIIIISFMFILALLMVSNIKVPKSR